MEDDQKACPFALNQRIISQMQHKIANVPPAIQEAMFSCIQEKCMAWDEEERFCLLIGPYGGSDGLTHN